MRIRSTRESETVGPSKVTPATDVSYLEIGLG